MKNISLQTREKLRQSRLGKKWSEDIKKKMSESHKGLKPWNTGTKGIMKPGPTSFVKGDPRLMGKNNSRWVKKITKKCPVCGKKFQVIPSLMRIKSCSAECGRVLKKGRSPWNKGLTKKTDKRVLDYVLKNSGDNHPSKRPEVRKKMSESHKGPRPWMLGRKANPETIEKLRKSHLGQKAWNKGGHFPEFSGENHPAWNGGSSFEEYGVEFNQALKDKIRARDNYECQLCGKKENGKQHITHHIDYDKTNNKPENLILLCNSHHSKTNYNRQYWINILKIRIIA